MTLGYLMARLQPCKLWGCGYHLLPLLRGPLFPGMVAFDRVLSMCQIQETVCKLMTSVEVHLLHSNTRNHLTVQRIAQALLRMLSTKCLKSYMYLIFMHKENLTLNNLTKPIQTNPIKGITTPGKKEPGNYWERSTTYSPDLENRSLTIGCISVLYLGILAVLNDDFSKSSSPFNNPLVTLPKH